MVTNLKFRFFCIKFNTKIDIYIYIYIYIYILALKSSYFIDIVLLYSSTNSGSLLK